MFKFKKIKGDHLFRDIDSKIREKVVERIIEASTPRKSFFVMIAVSSIICTAGLMMESVALIIGAMLIAPMIAAILSVSLGVIVKNPKLFFRSILVTLKASVLLFVAAFGTAMFFDISQEVSYAKLLKADFQLEIFVVALVVGFVATLSFVREELSQYITGTAIAVTLIPPMCISAVALRMGYTDFFLTSLRIFSINLVGIIISSMLIFLVTGFYHSGERVLQELKEERKLLESLTHRERVKKWFSEGVSLLINIFKR